LFPLFFNKIADNCIPLNDDVNRFLELTKKDCTKEDVKAAVKKTTGRVPFVLKVLLDMMLDFFENTKNPREPRFLTFDQFYTFAKKNGLDYIRRGGLSGQRAKLALSLCKNFNTLSDNQKIEFLKHAGAHEAKEPTEEELAKKEEELKKRLEREAALGKDRIILRSRAREVDKEIREKEKQAAKDAEKKAKDKERAEKVKKEKDARKADKRKRDEMDPSSSKRKKPT
jgi:hypothetical protein